MIPRFSSLRLPAAVLLTASVLAAGSFLGSSAPSASALTSCDVASLTIDSEETAFLGLINAYRVQNGLSALTMSTNLNRAASWLAVDLGTKNYFSHTDSLGRSPSTRAMNCGSPAGAGENIAAGTSRDTAQEAFDAWKASSGHNANMLNGSYKQIGIARYYVSSSTYKWYWVTDFSLVNDGTNAGGSGGGTTPTATPPAATSTPRPSTPTATAVPATPTATMPPATATATPPPASTPVAAKATLKSPAAGSTLPGSSATFTWNAGTSAQEYWVYVGTSKGASNLYNKQVGLSLSTNVTGLPRNGQTLYMRLWTRINGAWQYNDYTFRAAR